MDREKAIELVQQLTEFKNKEEFSRWIEDHSDELDELFFQVLEAIIKQNSKDNPQLSNYLQSIAAILRGEEPAAPALPPRVEQLIADVQSGKVTESEVRKIRLTNEEAMALGGYLERIAALQPQPPLAPLLAELLLKIVDNISEPRLKGMLIVVCAGTFKARPETIPWAIETYKAALKIFRQLSDEQLIAATQNNLGNAYRDLPTGDRGQHLNDAIICYKEALTEYTKDEFPVKYAATQNNLGAAYYDLPTGDRGQHLNNAIICYKEALTISTKEKFPVDYAMTQNNLGNAYRDLPTGRPRAASK